MKKINKTLQAAKVSRRSVLKGAAATGAAAAIGPYYVPTVSYTHLTLPTKA